MIELRGERLEITDDDLASFEMTLPTSLPLDYRRFMLDENGGAPSPNTARYGHGAFILDYFYPLGGFDLFRTPHMFTELSDLDSVYRKLKKTINIPPHLLPIANTVDEHILFLSLQDSEYGTVHAWFNHPDPALFELSAVHRVFSSFTDLCDSLQSTNITQHLNPLFDELPNA